MTQPPDHRAFPRVPIGYRVKIVTDEEMISYAAARNVSLGGLLFEPTPALKVGHPCGIAILLTAQDTGKRIVARGQIVRSDALGTAVQFTRPLDPASLTLLESLVQSLLPEGTRMGACG